MNHKLTEKDFLGLLPKSDKTKNRDSQILDSMLSLIDNTPLVRINKIAKDLECEVVAKCEFMNPSGSSKDRIAKNMLLDKFKKGQIRPGMTVIEPTSGNTGIAVALAGAVLGLKIIVIMQKKNAGEKSRVLRALGATVVETPDNVPHDSPMSNTNIADKILLETENAVLLDQYNNPANPEAHLKTASELIKQCGGKIDMAVIGVGTGGTATGISRGLKEFDSSIQIVGVEPEGSSIQDVTDPVGPFLVEGMGYDFVPDAIDLDAIDQWEKTNDVESLLMARRLVREEGILCGASSGAVMAATLRVAKNLGEGQRCVVIFPDSIRNYMTKFVDDVWMIRHGIMSGMIKDSKIINKKVRDLKLDNNLLLEPSLSCDKAFRLTIEKNVNYLAVKNKNSENKQILGIVSKEALRKSRNKRVEDIVEKKYEKIFTFEDISKCLQIFSGEQNKAVVFAKTEIVTKIGFENENVFVSIVEPKDIWQS